MSLRIRTTFFFIIQLIISCALIAQESKPIVFTHSLKRLNSAEVLLSINAKIKPDIKLYAIQKSNSDAIGTFIQFDSSSSKFLKGDFIESLSSLSENDSTLNSEVKFYKDSAKWDQLIRLSDLDSIVLKATINYMYKADDVFMPGEEKIKIYLYSEKTKTNNSNISSQSLWWIFFAAFGGGLLALLTPCVYSMIPITVSFFTKRSKNRAEGIRNALYYAISIVLIFTGLGFLITLIFGPAALNNLATNWIANLIFFLLFLIFGISFLGAFEIKLPASWMNKSDSKASTNSIVGIFFMALTLVLVSFSCTGPIIGNLLVMAAKGSYLGPLVGMLGFSIAIAFPFALFAFFPSKLNVLGKAGGWLNTIKVTLGFLELALALKFLSNADLVNGWRILDREVFVSLWIVIFGLLGLYLIGKIKFHHDDELPKNDFGVPFLSISRLVFSIASFAFALYMIPGLWGAPLKAISAFVPPMGTQDFVVSASGEQHNSQQMINESSQFPHPVKYYENLKMYEPKVVKSNGIVTYFDYNEALEVSKKLKKPLMLDFTGINCVNCRKMEGQVWSDPQVVKRLKEDFVIASLYVDVQNIDLQEHEQYYSKAMSKTIETLGDKNADIQVTKFGANSQPYYFFLDAKENKLINEGYGYDPDINQFIKLLDKAKMEYNKNK